MNTWLDLCSGLGGASRAATELGWRVVTLDIDPGFKPSLVADVRALPLRPFAIDVLWASPPCQQFSRIGLPCFFPNEPEPDLSIAYAVRDAIEYLRPRIWVVENVLPARRWFSKIFGPVMAMLPGHALWSSHQVLFPNVRPHKGRIQKGKYWGPLAHVRNTSGVKRSEATAVASMIPFEIGAAVCRIA